MSSNAILHLPEQIRSFTEILYKGEMVKVDLNKKIEEPEARFSINQNPISSPGNLTTILAQAKVGKTAYIGAMIASAICAENQILDSDTLGVSSSPVNGRTLIHIDTEQSPYDCYNLLKKTIKRAGVDMLPNYIWSYSTKGWSIEDLNTFIQAILWQAKKTTKGVHSLIIDGAADLVNDVNNADECNALVYNLDTYSVDYNIPIICVLHENPGSFKQNNGKARGHLGSQLERKSESVLKLKRDEQTTVVFGDKMRRAPILEKYGPRYAWSHQHEMMMSVSTKGLTSENKKKENFISLAQEVFKGEKLNYPEVIGRIMRICRIQESTAEAKFTYMNKLGIFTKHENGIWSLNL